MVLTIQHRTKYKNLYIFFITDLVTRPVLIVGPLSEAVLDKLMSDYPHKFARCEPEYMNCNQEALEKVRCPIYALTYNYRN